MRLLGGRNLVRALLPVVGTLLLATAAFGARENAQCLQCHGDASIMENGSRARMR